MSTSLSVQQKREERNRMMLEDNLLKVIPIIALPQVVSLIIDSIYNMADTFFVSQLGKAATAAVGVNDSLMMVIRAISLGFGLGASSYISRRLGAKDHDEASRAASTTAITAISVIAVLSRVAFIFREPLVVLMGATENAKKYAVDYATWTLLFAPVTALSVCLENSLRAEGSTTLSMIGNVTGGCLNMALDPIFISKLGLGVAGAAIATGISKCVTVIMLLRPYLAHKCVVEMKISLFKPSKDLYSEIARMGIPAALRIGLMSVSTIVINNLAGSFGDAPLAAVSVANKTMKMVASAVMGFSQGMQPIAGYCYGAKNYTRTKKVFLYTCCIGIVGCLVLGLILGIFAPQAITVFSKDVDVLDVGVTLIRSQCIVLTLHVLVMICTSFFQSLGKAFRAGFIGLTRQAFSLIPVALIMTHLFGLYGLSISQAVSDVVSFAFAVALLLPIWKELSNLEKEQLSAAGK